MSRSREHPARESARKKGRVSRVWSSERARRTCRGELGRTWQLDMPVDTLCGRARGTETRSRGAETERTRPGGGEKWTHSPCRAGKVRPCPQSQPVDRPPGSARSVRAGFVRTSELLPRARDSRWRQTSEAIRRTRMRTREALELEGLPACSGSCASALVDPRESSFVPRSRRKRGHGKRSGPCTGRRETRVADE